SNVTIQATSTSIGGFAGTFQWGPVLEINTMANETQLVGKFWTPNDATAVSFFTAANFLSYSNNLQTVRVVGTTAKNAVASGTALLIKNVDQYTNSYANGQASVGSFAAKYPGVIGNSLRVEICGAAGFSKSLTGT